MKLQYLKSDSTSGRGYTLILYQSDNQLFFQGLKIAAVEIDLIKFNPDRKLRSGYFSILLSEALQAEFVYSPHPDFLIWLHSYLVTKKPYGPDLF